MAETSPCPICQGSEHPPESTPPDVCPACGRTSRPVAPPATVPARSKRVSATGVVAVLMLLGFLGGVGYLVVDQSHDLDATLDLPPGTQLPVPRRPEHRSTVVIGRDGDRAIVSLARTRELPLSESFIGRRILGHELFRQALLIAARDGLGAGVRDEMLGETIPDPTGGPGLELLHAIPRDSEVQVELGRPSGEILWSGDFNVESKAVFELAAAIAKIEVHSREGLVGALGTAGVASASVARSAPDPAVPEAVTKALDRLTFVSQFGAVRALHEAARPGPPSAEQLGALARAYTNLGVLTEHHWNASHKAFEARALLYSQRMVALHPDSPHSYWNRAYARGLIGMHRDAMSDLEEATIRSAKLPAGERPAPPAWVELVRLRCNFEIKGLLAASTDPALAPLATILALMAVEHSRSTGLALEAVRGARQANPDCLWVNDASCRIRKLSHLHVATLEGLALFGRVIPRELKALPGLPDGAAKLLASSASEVEVARALIDAGAPGVDPVEPSWSVLGRMTREARFAQVARRVEFMGTQWNVPVDDFLDQARSMASDHPFWPLLTAYAVDHRSGAGGTIARLRAIPTGELEATEHLYVNTLRMLGDPDWQEAYMNLASHGDWVDRDQAWVVINGLDDDTAITSRTLREVSPESPVALSRLIEKRWDLIEGRWPDVEARYARQPENLFGLGKHYVAVKRYQDAERAFAAAIKLSPDQETYVELAGVYKALGQMDRWKETLDTFLNEEDPGLDHARVRVELANYFMERREFAKAKVYAEASATTGAGWAMECAARCAEEMGDWGRAEYWHIQDARRYPISRMNWFFFCARTGHGNREAAARMMEQYIAAAGDDTALNDLLLFGTYYILTKQPRLALEVYRRASDGGEKEDEVISRAVARLQVAVIADELGDVALRDRSFDEFERKMEGKAAKTIQILRLVRGRLVGPPAEGPDLKAVDAVFDTLPDEAKGNIGYIVARLLDLHGREKEAVKYYGYGANIPSTDAVCHYLCINALRSRGIPIGPAGDL